MSLCMISCDRKKFKTETTQAMKNLVSFSENVLNFVIWYLRSPFYIKGKTK